MSITRHSWLEPSERAALSYLPCNLVPKLTSPPYGDCAVKNQTEFLDRLLLIFERISDDYTDNYHDRNDSWNRNANRTDLNDSEVSEGLPYAV